MQSNTHLFLSGNHHEVSRRVWLHHIWGILMAEVTSCNSSRFLTLSFSPPHQKSVLISVVFCSFPAGENTRKHHRGKSKSQRTGSYLWVICLFLLGGLKEDFPITRLFLFPGKCPCTDCFPLWRTMLHCCSFRSPLLLALFIPSDPLCH